MKNVFAKIAQIGEEIRAIESMKVEFAAVDDAVKMTKAIAAKKEELKAEFNKLTKVYNQFSRVQNDFRDGAKKAILEGGFSSNVKSMLNKIEQEAKALGVNPENIKAYSELKAAQDDLAKFNKTTNSLIKDMAAVIGVKV
jgi:phage host-nuclease inhibitor protein Gam